MDFDSWVRRSKTPPERVAELRRTFRQMARLALEAAGESALPS
jgi:hypothetical protein